MAELNEVKAVGFAFFSPEVVLLVSDRRTHCLHFFPSKIDGNKSLDLSDSTLPHWVLLKSPEHLGSMISYADRISRLIVFGRPEELLGLGLPILDGTITSSGVEKNGRGNRDELLARIDAEAVPLSLTETGKIYETLRKQERDKMEHTPSGKTFFQQLKELKASVGKDNKKLNFIQQVGIPAVLRIMGDNNRDDFMAVCKALVGDGGVDEGKARAFYRWVEGFDGEGVELGKAVDALLYPKQASEYMRSETEWTDELTEALATKFGVSSTDLLFVARSYVQLQEDKAPAPPPPAEEVDDGFPTEFAGSPEEAEEAGADGDEEEEKEEAEAKYPGEDGFTDDPFGWPEEGDGDGAEAESDTSEAAGFHETTLEEEDDNAAEASTSVFDDDPDFSDFT